MVIVRDCNAGELSRPLIHTVDFESFQKVLNRPGGFRDPGEPEEYCRGFQVFDKDMTGFIGVGQLRYSMFGTAFGYIQYQTNGSKSLQTLGRR